MSENTCSFEARIVKEAPSGKAWLVDIEGEEMWIPKEGVHDDSPVWKDEEGYDDGLLILHEWCARMKGLV